MTDTTDWDGTERRKDSANLDRAIAEVRNLRPAILQLAEAFTIKSEVLHTVLVRIAVLFLVLFIGLMIMSGFWVTGLNHHMDKGHDRIICTLNLTPEQKAALAGLGCR